MKNTTQNIVKENSGNQNNTKWNLLLKPNSLTIVHALGTLEVQTDLGYAAIAKRFFKNEIPTEAETEYAINFIEDTLMANKSLPQHFETLYWADEVLQEIFERNELQQTIVSRQNVEDLFTVYARVVMGAPGSFMNVEVTAEGFARLLIVRELLHHLDIQKMERV